MKHSCIRLASVLVCLAMIGAASAYAQGGGATTTLSGVVVDTSGGVIPGADVVAKHNATNTTNSGVTDAEGRFTIPALPPGTYTVTVSLMGFKTVVLPDIALVAATPLTLRATLEVGNLEETVVVQGAAELVQTQTAAVTSTLTTAQITRLPMTTRNTLDYVSMLPGVNTSDTIRNSTVMGLRASATNITIDGLNVQDNYLKSSDGFFARINPRLDAVEEVTVSTANPGAESAGQGAVQIRFQTRSGTNTFQGSAYHYMRRPNWNSNYWFNERDGLPKDKVKVDTYGFRVGGPVVKDKLFYFFNYEEFRQPGAIVRNRTVLTPDAVNGLFSYNAGGGVRSVNVYDLAKANGQIATPDPTVAKLLGDIQGTLSKGTLKDTGNPITQEFSYTADSLGLRRYPTTRIDYNVNQKHRAGVSSYFQQYDTYPDQLNSYDPAFPGFPNQAGQYSLRWSVMGNLRSTISSNMVNELRGGATGGAVRFGDGVTNANFTGSIGNQDGFALNLPSIVTDPYRTVGPNERDAPTYVLEDTLSWIKGRHSINIGGSFTQINLNYVQHTVAPVAYLGLDSNDPANAMFNTTNFPGASGTNLSEARALYAMLTGRVTQITGTAYLNGATGKYEYLGDRQQLGHMQELGLFIQDAFRLQPNLTVNYGIRYELQMPFVPLNDYYSKVENPDMLFGLSGPGNLFKPGANSGSVARFVPFKKGDKAYNTDWNNFAPSFGAAWRPTLESGSFLSRLLSTDPVVRAGYSLSYLREGMATYSNIFSFNPGGNVPATRSMSSGTLVSSYSELPLLFRDKSKLGAPDFPESPEYPITSNINNSVNVFDPNTKTPYVHSFNLGFQRTLTKNTAMEIRYVATRQRGGWVDGGRNMNEYNLLENGFLDEFKLAQANLQANIAAGRGSNFKYYGPGTGTSPLPSILAYFNGTNASGDASKYTSSNFSSSTYLNYLAKMNPNPSSFASGLHGSSTFRNNATSAGLPANFFVVNPDASGAYITGRAEDGRSNNYDALQLELRRRLSNGLLLQGSYQNILRSEYSNWYTLREPQEFITSSTATHSFKLNWVYELPFGQGKRFGGNVSRAINHLVGGWTFDGSGQIRSGNQIDFGNVRLVGMTDSDLQKMFKLHKELDADGKTRVYMLPKSVIDNTIKAYNVSATSADGYSALGAPTGQYIAPINSGGCIQAYTGSCGYPMHHFVNGPMFVRFDMSVAKRVEVTKRVFMDLRMEILNVFNNVNFYGRSMVSPYTSVSDYEVTSAYRDTNNTQDPGGRLIQLSYRISW